MSFKKYVKRRLRAFVKAFPKFMAEVIKETPGALLEYVTDIKNKARGWGNTMWEFRYFMVWIIGLFGGGAVISHLWSPLVWVYLSLYAALSFLGLWIWMDYYSWKTKEEEN